MCVLEACVFVCCLLLKLVRFSMEAATRMKGGVWLFLYQVVSSSSSSSLSLALSFVTVQKSLPVTQAASKHHQARCIPLLCFAHRLLPFSLFLPACHSLFCFCAPTNSIAFQLNSHTSISHCLSFFFSFFLCLSCSLL